jgi:hypothetical protein
VEVRYSGLALLLFALASQPANAQMYKWVDENGRTQFSDRPPPPGVKFVTTNSTPATAPPPAAAKNQGSTVSNQEIEFRKRHVLAAEREKEEERKNKSAQVMRQNCDIAQQRLRDQEQKTVRYRTNANNEREYLTDDEREAEKNETRKRIAENCK